MNIFVFKDRNNTEAGYIQITEEELQAYKKNSDDKVYLINLGHSIMEVDKLTYTDRGYTQTDRRFRKNNECDDVYIHTRWTHEGTRFLYEFLKLHNILPVYERCK